MSSSGYHLTHLRALEAESIHILREVAAEFERPVMLYSIGKDSAVMLRLAQKAFHPGRLPFPLLHIDTTWKFRAMIEFRDQFCREQGLELKVWTNRDGVAQGVNPFDSGSKTSGVVTISRVPRSRSSAPPLLLSGPSMNATESEARFVMKPARSSSP